jgi:hypothetical protein
MTAPDVRSRLVSVALVAVLAAGCGGSSQVKPSAYVKSMCLALGNWKNTIQSAGLALQSSGAATASPSVAKADYQKFVTALVTTTRRTSAALRSAGTPAIKRGDQIASRLAAAFDRATTRLDKARTEASSIRTDSPSTFQLGASSVNNDIKGALEGILAVSPGQNQELRKAAAREPACQVLQG